MIIDAHVHLPVGEEFPSLQAKKERLLQELKKNQVDRCIVISDSYMDSPIGTMEECVKLFEDCPEVSVVGGISPFVEFSVQLEKMRVYLEQKKIVGMKLFTGHEDFYLSDERLRDVYDMAIQFQVPVLFHSGWDNPWYSDAGVVEVVLQEYPTLKMVCCHCFYPHIDKCIQLMKYPNLYFDISSVADDEGILEQMKMQIMELIHLAPERVMFGSDAFGCSMEKHLAFVRRMHMPPDLQQKIFQENAKRLFENL